MDSLRLYWPVITYQDKDKTIRKLSTPYGYTRYRDAKEAIQFWSVDFHLRSARIDVYDCSVFPIKKVRTYNLF